MAAFQEGPVLDFCHGHKREQSQDSGAYIDWNSEDSSSPTGNVNSNVKGEFITVVAVESNGIEEPEKSPFVTVLEIGDNNEKSYDVVEEVLVYRLPGERLGFGLKFEGGTNTAENVKRLFIQSSAPDSPASRAECSWGALVEGDEILKIDDHPIKEMTRLDCVRFLKESSVVIKLHVRHPGKTDGKCENQPTTPTVIAEMKKRTPPPPPIPPRKIPRKSPAPPPKDESAVVGPPEGFTDENYPVPKARTQTESNKPNLRVPQKDSPRVIKRNGFDLRHIPPEPEVYLDLLAQEDVKNNCESESDDTGSTISTVVGFSSMPTTTNSSFSDLRSSASSVCDSTTPSTPTSTPTTPVLDLSKILSPNNDYLFTKLINDKEPDSISYDEKISTCSDDVTPLQPPLSFQDAPLSYGNEEVRATLTENLDSLQDEVFLSSLKNYPEDALDEVDLSNNEKAKECPSPKPTPSTKKTSLIPRLAKSIGLLSPPKPSPRKDPNDGSKTRSKKRPPPPPPPPRTDRPLCPQPETQEKSVKSSIPYLKKKKSKQDDEKKSSKKQKNSSKKVTEPRTCDLEPKKEEIVECETKMCWPVPELKSADEKSEAIVQNLENDESKTEELPEGTVLEEFLPDSGSMEFGVEAVTSREPYFLFQWGGSKQLETIGEDEEDGTEEGQDGFVKDEKRDQIPEMRIEEVIEKEDVDVEVVVDEEVEESTVKDEECEGATSSAEKELKGDHWWSFTPPSWWPPQYATVARSNVPEVAQKLYQFLQRKSIVSLRLHLIGFSLGAHIAGRASIIGHPTNRQRADRISAIDPAGPIFEHSMDGLYTPDMIDFAIKADSAEFVDAIHASSLLGMSNNVGHVDHFAVEKECNLPPCTHSKALDWYIDSIIQCSFISCPKDKYQEIFHTGNRYHWECVNTNDNEFSSMGFMSDRFPGRGRHNLALYVKGYVVDVTNNPVAVYEPLKCSYYKAIKSTVEGRQCYHPPNWVAECPRCRNEQGELVNFFIMYKFPNGFQYAYMYKSHDLTFHSWQVGRYGIDDARSVLGQTLSPLYSQYNRTGVTDLEHIIWNDDDREVVILEIPTGHSKGVMAFDSGRQYNRVFLLSHSIPKLLADHDNWTRYVYPESGRLKAQHAICMSMNLPDHEIIQILNGLTKFKPLVISTSEGSMRDQAMVNAMNTLRNPPRMRYGQPLHHQIQLNNGFQISISERTKKANAKDHIKRIAEDVYQANVKSQTWLLGNGEKWNSDCTGSYTVENIRKVDFGRYLTPGTGWETTTDHSKWFVSKDDNKPFVCLGDLNRMRSTMARGGLFICTSSLDVYNNFKHLPTDIEECSTNINSVDDIKWHHGRHVVWSYNCEISLGRNVIETRTMARAEDCAPLCVNTVGCEAFVWSHSTCSLKSSGTLGDAIKMDHGVCGVTLFKEVQDQDKSIHWKDGDRVVWSYNCDINRGHSDLQDKPMTKAEECAPWCREISECQAFVWRDGTCFLKSAGNLNDAIPWDHGVCGVTLSKNNREQDASITWQHGNRVVWSYDCELNYGSSDLDEKPMARAEDCAPWCLLNRGCRAFVWRDSTCFLKSAGSLRDTIKWNHGVCGVTLSKSIQYQDQLFNWEHGNHVVWSNDCDINPGHSDLQDKPMTRVEECGPWCVQTSECQAYAWRDNKCFLKTVGNLRDAVKLVNAVCGVKLTK